MFARWWLRKELNEMNLKQQEIDAQSKTYCLRCKKHSMYITRELSNLTTYTCDTCGNRTSYEGKTGTPTRMNPYLGRKF